MSRPPRPESLPITSAQAEGRPDVSAPLGAPMFTKRTLAQHLSMSVRSLDRAAAMSVLPEPDLIAGRSPRWSAATIERWLRNCPRLPGRKEGRHV
jgi:hypothetical protein